MPTSAQTGPKTININTASQEELTSILKISETGFDIVPGEHPIVPIMLGEATLAKKIADFLLQKGIYVIGFSYPVVPKGKARIRTQISAAHKKKDLDLAIEMFTKAKKRPIGYFILFWKVKLWS